MNNADPIFTPLKFRNLEVKNRIFRSNMTGPFDEYDGTGSEFRIRFDEQFARGGVGAICSAHVPISAAGRISPHIASIDNDSRIAFWEQLIKRIHKHNCKYIIQLLHSGRQRDEPGLEFAGDPGMSSTSHPDPVHGLPARAMSKEDIALVRRQFVDAAGRALKAGADGVELHAANGYLFTQFLSAAINDRKDEYGGSLENRARFLLEVVQAIRERHGNGFHFQIKISIPDFSTTLNPFAKSGNTLDENLEVCRWLEANSVDAIVVSAGSFTPHPKNPAGDFPLSAARQTYDVMLSSGSRTLLNYLAIRTPGVGLLFQWWWAFRRGAKSEIEGILSSFSQKVKAHVGIPVLVTGGYQTASFIRDVISQKKADAVTIARPLLANPNLVQLFEQGHNRPPRPCTYCNKCLIEALQYPLACYEPERFDSRQAMIDQILAIYQ
jgi:2,4-dienoyl-CoA reductase (NADPH2)